MSSVYFMSAPYRYNLTGIEHAINSRFALLSFVKQNRKILTLNYSTELEPILNLYRLRKDELINIYSYYQNFRKDIFFIFELLLAKLNSMSCVPVEGNTNDFKIYCNGIYTMYVHCFNKTNKVSYINYFNNQGQKIRRELYDYLGYLSSEIILHDSKTVQQNFFNVDGEIYLRVNHYNDEKLYTLLDEGKTYFFSSEADMHAHWLRKILKDDDIVFIDKNRIYNPILSKLQDIKLKKIAIIHSTHTHNPNIDDKKKLNSNYKFLLENQNQFSACVVATESQYKDLCTDFKMDIPVYVIPPSYIESHRINTNLKNDHLRILSIGRIAVEKRQEDMIKAMKIVIQAVPNATLELYGMANIEIKNKLIALIESENLKNHVFIKPYASDIKKELYNSHLSLVTSKVESFCIAILDSLEQGTPVISYDIKYGPAAIIDHESNGFLVEDGNVQALAETIVSYYESGMNQYRDNTVLVENNYGKEQVQTKWIKLLEDMSKL